VDEVLRHLPEGAYVLDLGSRAGSFDAGCYPVVTIKTDLDAPDEAVPNFVRSDAARLPFATGAFSAVISNHSLEHFADLEASLREIGRVIRKDGQLYIAVPDSSTLTDRIYRWIANGGGHVNPFLSVDDLIARIERACGLRHVATRLLHTSLSFLNKGRGGRWPRRKLWLLGGGGEPSLAALTYLLRLLDPWSGSRASAYGWALYFGAIHERIDPGAWTNVCIRCGAGHSSASLLCNRRVERTWLRMRRYDCPNCGARNLFTDDPTTA